MNGKQNGPRFESVPLITGAALLGAGTLIALVGLGIGGGHLVAATRRWLEEMEVPPSEQARQKLMQARAAAAAGASAWQNGSTAGAATAS
jgi:hypothetical protein